MQKETNAALQKLEVKAKTRWWLMVGRKELVSISLRIHVWYICLHLVDFYGKCRQIYHTWILRVWYFGLVITVFTPILPVVYNPFQWVNR